MACTKLQANYIHIYCYILKLYLQLLHNLAKLFNVTFNKSAKRLTPSVKIIQPHKIFHPEINKTFIYFILSTLYIFKKIKIG